MNPLTILTALLPALQIAGPILAQQIPALAPIVGALGGVNPTQHTSIVSLIQEILNALNAAGVIQLPKPLVVDGQFGGATFGAIKAVQAKFGLNLGEPLASYEMQALQALLAKL